MLPLGSECFSATKHMHVRKTVFLTAMDQPQMSKISLEKRMQRSSHEGYADSCVSMIYVTFFLRLLFYGVAAIPPCSGKESAMDIPWGAMFPEHTLVRRGEIEGSRPPPWPSVWCEPHHSILHVAFQLPCSCALPSPQPCPAPDMEFFQEAPPAKKAGWHDGACVTDLLPVRLTVVHFSVPQSFSTLIFCMYMEMKQMGIFSILLPIHNTFKKMYVSMGRWAGGEVDGELTQKLEKTFDQCVHAPN